MPLGGIDFTQYERKLTLNIITMIQFSIEILDTGIKDLEPIENLDVFLQKTKERRNLLLLLRSEDSLVR